MEELRVCDHLLDIFLLDSCFLKGLESLTLIVNYNFFFNLMIIKQLLN